MRARIVLPAVLVFIVLLLGIGALAPGGSGLPFALPEPEPDALPTVEGIRTEVLEGIQLMQPTVVMRFHGEAVTFDGTGQILDTVVKQLEKSSDSEYLNVKALRCDYSGNDGEVTCTFSIEYITNPEEEAWVEGELARVVEAMPSGLDDYGKIRYLHDFLVQAADYDSALLRPGAYPLLKEGKGTCHGYTLAMHQLLTASGYESLIVTGTLGAEDQGHAWNKVRIGARYYNIDVTNDDYNASERYFLVSDRTLRDDGFHWRSTDYPSALSDYSR